MEGRHSPDVPPNVKSVLRTFFVLCALLILVDAIDWIGRIAGIDALAFKSGRHYDAEAWFGFYGFYGFVGCVLLVLAARVLRVVVMRDEDYYSDPSAQDGSGGDRAR